MHKRETIEIGEYYHVFNRGVEKRRIFYKKSDYERFIRSLVLFNTEKPSWQTSRKKDEKLNTPKPDEQLVDIVAYCINPNHFHLLLKENKRNGIATFMKKICTGYAMYFNRKNERSGILFQGRFKSIHINSNDLFLYISVYVNCNSEIHRIEKAGKYPWCSFLEYSDLQDSICQKNVILDQFKNPGEYRNFCQDKVVGMIERKKSEDESFEY